MTSRTINITPTWSGLLPGMVAAAANGNQDIMSELRKLTRTIDGLNAIIKADRGGISLDDAMAEAMAD